MDKDKKKNSKPEVEENQRLQEVIFFLFVILFFYILVARVDDILVYFGLGSPRSMWERLVDYFLSAVWPWLKFLALIASVAAIAGIYYSFTRLRDLLKEEQAIYGKDYPYIVDLVEGGGAPVKNEKWEEIIKHINSSNTAEWRQAIIEADIILDELLTASGYHGDSIGEKLRSVEPSDFLTLDSAWSAHKVRNKIAHDGSKFELNEREAKATITHFEAVFKEFKII